MTLTGAVRWAGRSILFNSADRLRAGWRIFVCFFIASVGWAIGDTAIVTVLDGFADEVGQVVINMLVVVGTVALMSRYLDHRSLSTFGLQVNRQWQLDLLGGLTIGALTTFAVFGAFLIAGWASIETIDPVGPAFVGVLLVGVVTMGCLALNEELLFRGYILKNMIEGFQWLTPRIAVVIAWVFSSLLFVLFHANPVGRWSVTLHFLLSGMVFALPMLLCGRLAMGIGIHLADNFVAGYIFGLGGEAVGIGPSVATITHGNAGLWFGPTGIVSTGGLIVAIIAVLAWMRWQEDGLSLHLGSTARPSVKHSDD